MAFKADLIEESGLRQNEDGSYEQTRVFRVDGLSTASPSSWHFQALTAAGVPAHNSLHPVYGSLLRAKTRDVRPMSASQAKIVVVFRSPSGGGADPPEVGEEARLSIGGAIEGVLTNKDKNNKILTHDFQGVFNAWPRAHPQVLVDRVIPFLRYSQREVTTPTAILDKVRTYAGKLNSADFAGAAPRTLKCLINAEFVLTNESGQKIYDMTYEFFYNEETWRAATKYEGKRDGIPPPSETPLETLRWDLDGLKYHDVLPEANFNGLGLI